MPSQTQETFNQLCNDAIADHGRAVGALTTYFKRRSDGEPVYTGSVFDTWAGGGDRPEVADIVTADDLVALSLLSMKLPGRVQLELLGRRSADLTRELAQLPTHLDLWDAEETHLEHATTAWAIVVALPGVGWVTAGKLLARKRPRLIPIYDSVVYEQLGRQKSFWRPLATWLSDTAVRDRLTAIRDDAAGGAEVAHLHVLRVFDIVVWMCGKGYDIDPERNQTADEE